MKDTKYKISYLIIAVVPAVAWLAWGIWGVKWVARQHAGTGTLTELGQTGDLFGGVNALFAAYAFLGVAVAAFFQYRTFQLVERQHQLDKFEPLFFQLLQLVENTKPRTVKNVGSSVNSAASTLDRTMRFLLSSMIKKPWFDQRPNMSYDQLQREVTSCYEPYYRFSEDELGPYLRSLYHLFKRINKSGLPFKTRVEYANIARAKMTQADLTLLAINCMTPFGAEFKPLVEGFGLLKHVRSDVVALEKSGREHEAGLAKLIESMFAKGATLGSDARTASWRQDRKSIPVGFEDFDAEKSAS